MLRALACVIAIAALIDPAVRTSRPGPLAVDVRAADGTLAPVGSPIRAQLEQALPGTLAVNTTAAARALIVDGQAIVASAIPDAVPVSFMSTAVPAGPWVRILSTAAPRPVLPGWSAAVTGVIEGRDMTPGSSSAIVLEHHGVEVDRIVHRWSKPTEQVTTQLSFVAPTAGAFAVSMNVLPVEGSTDGAAAGPAVQILAEARRLRILAFDPRPSWGSGFVRRSLEADPIFDVATRVRASRGPEVRTGAAPIALSDASLSPFDLALIGAPEDLTTGELAALERFASVRGGTVVFVADRTSSGGYLRLFGMPGLEETLLEKPIKATGSDGAALRGAEFAHPAAIPVGADALAEIPHGAGRRSPLLALPTGAGLLMFSGLLDSWRYRAEDDGAFDSFWRARLAGAAARAPRRLELTLTPGVAPEGSPVRLRAVVRATDLVTSGDRVSIPAIAARVIDQRGAQQDIRLWPTAELGVFEGDVPSRSVGRHVVRVETADGAGADTPLIVSGATSASSRAGDPELATVLAGATGGVAVTTGNLQPLVDRLRALPRETIERDRHPFRSPWWGVAFAGLLTAEWTLRRRRGLR
ncbi:MAG: hypothetical protein ABIX28_18240 [Vicinamibacterales bacterium]